MLSTRAGDRPPTHPAVVTDQRRASAVAPKKAAKMIAASVPTANGLSG